MSFIWCDNRCTYYVCTAQRGESFACISAINDHTQVRYAHGVPARTERILNVIMRRGCIEIVWKIAHLMPFFERNGGWGTLYHTETRKRGVLNIRHSVGCFANGKLSCPRLLACCLSLTDDYFPSPSDDDFCLLSPPDINSLKTFRKRESMMNTWGQIVLNTYIIMRKQQRIYQIYTSACHFS